MRMRGRKSLYIGIGGNDMTIDEAKSMLIAKANCIDKQCEGIYEHCNENLCDNCVLCYAQGTNGEQIKLLRQCAEWLEELKAYKEKPEGWMWDEAERKGYNKAIDDFTEKFSFEISESLIWGMIVDSHKYKNVDDAAEKIVDYVIETLKKVSEQLKAGGTSGTDNQ